MRQLQRRLWVAAKRSPERRFHALMDRIWRRDVLQEAWRRVKREPRRGGRRWRDDRRASSSTAWSACSTSFRSCCRQVRIDRQPVLRRYIPKADGRKRPLGIPTVRDRVVQMAAKLVLEPIFEADFGPVARVSDRRRATQALEMLRQARTGQPCARRGHPRLLWQHRSPKLMKLVALRISDRRVLKLLRQWLKAGVMEEGQRRETLSGHAARRGDLAAAVEHLPACPRPGVGGQVCAPGHAGALCRRLRGDVRHEGAGRGSPTTRRAVLTRLGLELHPDKTRRVDLSRGREGFDFLGCHLRKRMSGPIWERTRQRVFFLQRWPSQRAHERVRQRVRELTPRRGAMRTSAT